MKKNLCAISLVFLILIALTGCIGVEPIQTNDGKTTITFPNSDFGKNEYTSSWAFDIQPFQIEMELPQGWSCRQPDIAAQIETKQYLYSYNISCYTFSAIDIYDENGTNVGAFGYTVNNEPPEDPDFPPYVFSQLLGNTYGFKVDARYKAPDNEERFDIVTDNGVVYTALSNVYQSPAWVNNPTGHYRFNPGILSYNRSRDIYIAMELDGELVSEEQVQAIAESIVFKDL